MLHIPICMLIRSNNSRNCACVTKIMLKYWFKVRTRKLPFFLQITHKYIIFHDPIFGLLDLAVSGAWCIDCIINSSLWQRFHFLNWNSLPAICSVYKGWVRFISMLASVLLCLKLAVGDARHYRTSASPCTVHFGRLYPMFVVYMLLFIKNFAKISREKYAFLN